MKHAEILKELKEIKAQMSECIVGAWNEDLSHTTDAVLLGDMTDKFGDNVEHSYNGWSERFEALINKVKGEEDKLEDAIEKAGDYLSYESYAQMREDVIALTRLSDTTASLDHALGDDVFPVEKYEYCFTVGTFLEEIGYKEI